MAKKRRLNYDRIITLILIIFIAYMAIDIISSNLNINFPRSPRFTRERISYDNNFRNLTAATSNENITFKLNGINFLGNSRIFIEQGYDTQSGLLIAELKNSNNFDIICNLFTIVEMNDYRTEHNYTESINANSTKEISYEIFVPTGDSDITTSFECMFHNNILNETSEN